MNKKNLFIFLAIVLLLLFSSATIMVYAESGIIEQAAELYEYTVEQNTEVSIMSDDGRTQKIMLVTGNEYLFRNEEGQYFLDYIYVDSSLDDTVLTIKSISIEKELGIQSVESTIYKILPGMLISFPKSVGLYLTIPENQILTCYKDEDGAYTYLSDGIKLVKERLVLQDSVEDPSIPNTYIRVEENCEFEGVTIKENTLIPITNLTTSEFNEQYQFIYLVPIKSEESITYVTKQAVVPIAYCSVVLFSEEDKVSVIDLAEENELTILGEKIEIDAQHKFYYLNRNGEILLPVLNDKTISNALPIKPNTDVAEEYGAEETETKSSLDELKIEIEHLIFILLCILLLLMIWQIVLLYHAKKNKKTPEQESMKENIEFIVEKVIDKAKIGFDIDSITADGFRLLDNKMAVIEKLLRRKVDLTSPAVSHQMPIIKLTPVSIAKVKLHSYDINISQERGIISVREDKEIIFENTKKLSPYQIETYNLNYVFDFLSGMPEQTNKAILFDVEKHPQVELIGINYILKEKGTISFK